MLHRERLLQAGLSPAEVNAVLPYVGQEDLPRGFYLVATPSNLPELQGAYSLYLRGPRYPSKSAAERIERIVSAFVRGYRRAKVDMEEKAERTEEEQRERERYERERIRRLEEAPYWKGGGQRRRSWVGPGRDVEDTQTVEA
jgi:hypothetical protein